MRLNSFLLLSILPFSSAMAAPDADVQGVEQQIAAIQLDRALNLTHEQATSLLPLLNDAASKVAARQAAFASAKPQLLAALTQARDELSSTGTVSDATKQALAAARPTPQPNAMAAMKDFHSKLDQILTPAQQRALQTTQLGLWSAMPHHPGAMGMGADTDMGMGAGMKMGKGMHRSGKKFFAWKTLLSDPFLKLLQARAA
jgi:hypothetical protein